MHWLTKLYRRASPFLSHQIRNLILVPSIRWVRESGISSVGFGRDKTVYCYFAIATTVYHPQLRAVRMTSAKNGILLTIIDDFFDVHGSLDELICFTDAVERYLYIHTWQHPLLWFLSKSIIYKPVEVGPLPVMGPKQHSQIADLGLCVDGLVELATIVLIISNLDNPLYTNFIMVADGMERGSMELKKFSSMLWMISSTTLQYKPFQFKSATSPNI